MNAASLSTYTNRYTRVGGVARRHSPRRTVPKAGPPTVASRNTGNSQCRSNQQNRRRGRVELARVACERRPRESCDVTAGGGSS